MSVRVWIWIAVTSLFMTGLSTSSAVAGEFLPTGIFGSPGSGAGQFAGESPLSIAVDDTTGDVYAFDSGPNRRVEKFSAEGKFELEFEAPPESFATGDLGIAVDSSGSTSKGDVYVADTEHNVVDKFDSEGKYLGRLTGVSQPDGVAVDSTGNVYVTQLGGTQAIAEFDFEGNFVGDSTLADLTLPFGTVIDSKHHLLYVVNLSNDVVRATLNPHGEVEPGSEAVIDSHGSTAVAVDPATGDLFVADGEGGSHVVEYEPDGELLAEFGAGQIGTSLGLAFSSIDRHVFIADLANNRVSTYVESEPSGPLPRLIVESPTGLTPKGATFDGTINPLGLRAGYFFQYGPCTALGECATSPYPLKTAEAVVGEAGEATPIPVSASVMDLQPETAYHIRLSATNKNGTDRSEEVEFVTPPAAEVGPCEPGDITPLSAELSGRINPLGLKTSALFEYGTSTSYGSVAPNPPFELGGDEPILIDASIEGLQPNRTYHCRLTGTNGNGVGVGGDHEFKTPLAPPAVEAGSPSAVTRRTTIVSGEVNPENSGTGYHFEYVSEGGYVEGAANPYSAGASTLETSVGEGFEARSVGPVQLNGLRAGTLYHYRIIATNEGGTSSSPDRTFTTAARTPPVLGVAEAGAVLPTSATISEAVDPRGLRTTYEVDLVTEIGSESVDNRVSFGEVIQSDGPLTLNLEDLAPGTTYRYKIVATNEDGAGTAEGAFATPGVPPLVPQPLTPPFIATPSISFPTGSGTVLNPPKNGVGKPKKKHRRKTTARKIKGKRK